MSRSDATDVESNPIWLQIGPNGGTGDSLPITINAVHLEALGLRDPAVNVATTHYYIQQELGRLDEALVRTNTQRASLGAYQNRLEFTIQNLDIARENLSASESRIRDADMALEMMRLTNANILQQAATTMLAQANQAPQNILQLLQ